jgi:hypothetical protein
MLLERQNKPYLNRVIVHLMLTFIAVKPPPSYVAFQEYLMAAAGGSEYFL